MTIRKAIGYGLIITPLLLGEVVLISISPKMAFYVLSYVTGALSIVAGAYLVVEDY